MTMTKEEYLAYREELAKRIRDELHPDNCEYCGLPHSIHLLRWGTALDFDSSSCPDIKRRANLINNELLKKYK